MQLYAALFAREKALLNELEQFHRTKAFTLTEQRDRLRIFQACQESAVQRAMSTAQSGNTELLVARSDIIATLGAMEKQPLLLEPQVDCVLDFNINIEQLLDLLNNAGMVSDKSTCAANTTTWGAGLQVAIPGRAVSFNIRAHDAQGRFRGHGGDLFKVKLSESKGRKIQCYVKDKGDGNYKATYRCPADSKGNLRLSVLLRGSHIKGSPFSVNVTDAPVGKLFCDECGKRTDSMIYYKNKDPFAHTQYRALCYPDCEGHYVLSTFGPSPWTECCGPC